MKRKFLFVTSILFIGMVLFSCNGKNQGEDYGDNGGDDNIEPAYYSVLADNKFVATDIVNLIFSTMESNDQTLLMKGMIVNKLMGFTSLVEKEYDVKNIELGFRKVAYSYKTIGVDGKPLELSSVASWYIYRAKGDTVWYDISPERIALLEHYTITSDAECPTQSFPFELLVAGNTLSIMPDYIGYGLTRNMTHPYLNHDICMQNSVDALPAGYTLFKDLANVDLNDGWKLCVIGASQGGANALAVHKYMDTNAEFANKWNFEYSYAAVGPHNPSLTMKKYFEKGKTSYPVVFPLTLNAMINSYPEIMGKYTEADMFSEAYLQIKETISQMLESKDYTTAEINAVFLENLRITVDENLAENEIYLKDMLNDVMFDNESEFVKDLFKCFDKNDLTKGWNPTHPIKLYYSTADEVVPYENSLAVKEAFGDKVTTFEADAPLGHVEATLMWMIKVFTEGL